MSGRPRYPLHLVANQPPPACTANSTAGRTSQDSKIRGREPIRMHPADAARARPGRTATWCGCSTTAGACLAGVVVDDRLRRGVVQLSTGAWYDPEDAADPDAMCVHGNPNVLTADVGTSSLAKGCTGAHVLVEIEKYSGELPPLRAHQPPVIASRD